MKTWLLAFALGLGLGAIGKSMAAPRSESIGSTWLKPQQSGLFIWCPATRDYLRLDVVVQALLVGHNEIVPRLEALERAANIGRD